MIDPKEFLLIDRERIWLWSQVSFSSSSFFFFRENERESDGIVGEKKPDGEIIMFREENHVDA